MMSAIPTTTATATKPTTQTVKEFPSSPSTGEITIQSGRGVTGAIFSSLFSGPLFSAVLRFFSRTFALLMRAISTNANTITATPTPPTKTTVKEVPSSTNFPPGGPLLSAVLGLLRFFGGTFKLISAASADDTATKSIVPSIPTVKDAHSMKSDNADETTMMIRYGVIGAIVGYLAGGGPLLSTLLGCIAAYAYCRKNDKVGGCVQSLGNSGAFGEGHRASP